MSVSSTTAGKSLVQKGALGFGIVFVLIGLLGFIPFLNTAESIFGDNVNMDMSAGGMDHNYLLGIFAVGAVHNIIHILSGIVALVGYAVSHKFARLYFQVFAVVYLLVTIIGFATGSFLGLMDVNQADNLLHVLITLGAGYFGFLAGKPKARV